MARKKKQTQVEETPQVNFEVELDDVTAWIEEVTDTLEALVDTVNQNAQESNKLYAVVQNLEARIAGLEAFEKSQHTTNEIVQGLRRSLATRVFALEDNAFLKEPTLWERIKARFSSVFE